MTRLTKDQIYDLLREKGPLTTAEIRDYVYADDDRYSKQGPNAKLVYCYCCLEKLRRDGLVIKKKKGRYMVIWEVCA